MIKAHGLAHITLTVSDIHRTKKFYEQIFETEFELDHGRGFSLTTVGAPVWFVQWDNIAPDDKFDPSRIGLDHFAIKLELMAELDGVANKLIEMGVKTAGIQKFSGKYPYIEFKDPDNIQTEFFISKEI